MWAASMVRVEQGGQDAPKDIMMRVMKDQGERAEADGILNKGKWSESWCDTAGTMADS